MNVKLTFKWSVLWCTLVDLFCNMYCVPVVKGKGADDTFCTWDLSVRVTRFFRFKAMNDNATVMSDWWVADQ